jgi:hypothetical protein
MSNSRRRGWNGKVVKHASETCKTPAGTFSKCVKVKEGSARDLLVTEHKYYAPGIGLIRDEDLVLVKQGQAKM